MGSDSGRMARRRREREDSEIVAAARAPARASGMKRSAHDNR
jgi:hypothetical protein